MKFIPPIMAHVHSSEAYSRVCFILNMKIKIEIKTLKHEANKHLRQFLFVPSSPPPCAPVEPCGEGCDTAAYIHTS